MAVVLIQGLIFHYLDDFFAVFKKLKEARQFGTEFDNICIDLGVGVNKDKKQLGYIVGFLGLEFDTVKTEACLQKEKLEKAIKLLEKKSSTIHEELPSSDGSMAKGGNYLHWSRPIKDDLLWWDKFLPR